MFEFWVSLETYFTRITYTLETETSFGGLTQCEVFISVDQKYRFFWSDFRKFKVALNPIYKIYLNFAKSYILSCLSKLCNKKTFHLAVSEIYALKAEIKGVFSRS